MLKNLLRFEWDYHTRQPSFYAAVLFFFGMGFAVVSTGFGPENVHLNSHYLVMQTAGFLSLFSVFGVAIFASHAVLRDPEHRMEEIIFTTPISKEHYVLGRFGGCFLISIVAVAFSTFGMLAATWMPWQDPARIADFTFAPYGWSLLSLTIPNVLTSTALIIAVAVWTRNSLATYAAAVFIYILYFACAALTNSPLMAASKPGAGGGLLSAVFDPFGLSAFFENTRYWSIAERNHRFVALSGAFLLNRLVWLALAGAVLALVHKTFSFRLLRVSSRPKKKILIEPPVSGTRFPIAPAQKKHRWFSCYFSTAHHEIRSWLISAPFLLLLVLWMMLAASEIYSDVLSGEYRAAFYPTAGLIISTLRQPIFLISMILLIYYGAEVFWREHRYGMSPLINTTPAPNSVFIAAKWTSLALMIFSVIASSIFSGIAVQLLKGYWNFEPLVYFSLFYFLGLQLVLFAAAAILIHAFSPNRYVGMVLVLVLLIFSIRGQTLGFDHPLWRFASAAPVQYSSMNGFSERSGFHWFILYWSALAMILLMVAARLWRGLGSHWKERLRLLSEFSRRDKLLMAVLGCSFLLCGGWIFFNTNVRNAYTTSDELFDWKADYEKKYKTIEAQPQPRIWSVKLNVDLNPEDLRYDVGGQYEIINESNESIRKVMVAVRRDARVHNVSLRDSDLVSKDERFGMYAFQLHKELLPGDRSTLHFNLSYDNRGFTADGSDSTIVKNGTFVFSFLTVPTLGYRKSYELTDPKERRKRGLSGTGNEPVDTEPALGLASTNREWIHFAATISTAEDQIAIAPGRLQKTWMNQGRRHFSYVSDSPILNQYAIASARYRLLKRRHNLVDVELYYDPKHSANAGRILDVAVDSLDKFERTMSAYPSGQMRIVEVPSYWDFGGFAMPDTVFLNENRIFLIDTRDAGRPDLLMRRVAHEVAHLWWGYQLTPKNAEGASAIIESLTKFCELQIIRKKHGREHVRELLEMELDRYLKGRADEETIEPPLYKVGNQAYLYYGKGPLVFSAIQDLIGEGVMNAALADFLREQGGPNHAATSLDLLNQILKVSDASQQELISQWLKEIILYDLKIESAGFTKRNGKYEIRLVIDAAKSKADGLGNQTAIPFREKLEIGMFKHEPDIAATSDNILYLQKHDVHHGRNEFTILVDELPGVVAIDPYLLRIDLNRFNNRMGL